MDLSLLKTIIYVPAILAGSILFSSCEKNPTPENEEELITTLRYELTPRQGGEKVVMSFKDSDGNGGNQPVIVTNGFLISGQVYDGYLELLNETQSPATSINEEILLEDEEHQFFFDYNVLSGGNLQISYNDKDSDNLPVGLSTVVTAVAKGNGKLTITLKHLPEKKAPGVSSGDISNAGGETDIQVTFDVAIN